MCERVEDIVSALSALVGALDAASLRADRALALVDMFSGLERLATTGRTLAAGRVQQTNAWRATGASSATDWLARSAGSSLSQAAATLRTARDIADVPQVRDAMVSGQLSGVQAAEISAAASADPNSTETLLALASQQSVAALREHCQDVIAAVRSEKPGRANLRDGRYLRSWLDHYGRVRLDVCLAPDDAAPLLTTVRWRAQMLYQEARRAGQFETHEAHAADALCGLVDVAGAPNESIHVHVSQTALERGHTVAGETCKIDGVGPIPVAAARRMLMNGNVELLTTEGVDVHCVAHA